jgi:hypothetical protein
MKRLIGRPTFWIALVVLSFAMNLFIAVITLHRHIRYSPGEGPQTLLDLLVSSADGRLSGTDMSDAAFDTRQRPEGELWRRMLQQDVSFGCGTGRKVLFEEASSRTAHVMAISPLLPPKGFPGHVHAFINQSDSNNHRERSLSLRGSTSNSLPPKRKNSDCYFPPATSCSRKQYSVLMYSSGHNLRRTLLNLMACMAYPSINGITLILPFTDSLHDQLQGDALYGSRIWDWKTQGTIQIVSEATMWESVAQVQAKESAVLWIDGDRPKDWNGTIFRTNFRLWRQHSRALVAFLDVRSPNHVHDVESLSLFPTYGMHGNMMHRSWFCFLQHPVLDPLRRYLASVDSWEGVLSGISILFNHLGEGHVLAVLPGDVSKSISVASSNTSRSINQGRAASSLTSTILDYFGCSCAVHAIVPRLTNSTCVESDEEHGETLLDPSDH